MAEHRKRPRDPLQLAKLIGDIATGPVEDREPDQGQSAKSVRGRKGGLKGGLARAAALGPRKRQQIARKAASNRAAAWHLLPCMIGFEPPSTEWWAPAQE